MTVSVITGGTGFVGGHLAGHLVDLGHEVHVMARTSSSPVSLAPEVIVERFATHTEAAELVAGLQPDVLYHLATLYLREHRADQVPALIDANITFGTHLLEALAGTKTVVVSAMSYFQFFDSAPEPFSLYSATKQAFLEICEYFRLRRAVDIRQVVLYDTYGPGDTRDKLIPRLLEAARDGEAVGLGSPVQPLNLLYSSDVSAGMVAASRPDAPSMMRLRADGDVTVAELVSAVHEVSGQSFEVTYNPWATVNDLVARSNAWPPPPGWRPEVSLGEGLSAAFRASVS